VSLKERRAQSFWRRRVYVSKATGRDEAITSPARIASTLGVPHSVRHRAFCFIEQDVDGAERALVAADGRAEQHGTRDRRRLRAERHRLYDIDAAPDARIDEQFRARPERATHRMQRFEARARGARTPRDSPRA
jgi:hypothetical protein